MIASIALAHAATALPACCIPSSADCELAEALYCTYQQGGPPERAGLDWRGQPCPTWADLFVRAAAGDVGANGVIEKWRAVADQRPGKISHYADAIQLPCWGALSLAGREEWHGLIRPTLTAQVVEVIEPAIDGDAWYLPMPETRCLKPARGPLFYGLHPSSEGQVRNHRAGRRMCRPDAERAQATSDVLSQAVPGKHALIWESYEPPNVPLPIIDIDPPGAHGTNWRVTLSDGRRAYLRAEAVQLVELTTPLSPAELEGLRAIHMPRKVATTEADISGDVEHSTDPDSEAGDDATSNDGDGWRSE